MNGRERESKLNQETLTSVDFFSVDKFSEAATGVAAQPKFPPNVFRTGFGTSFGSGFVAGAPFPASCRVPGVSVPALHRQVEDKRVVVARNVAETSCHGAKA